MNTLIQNNTTTHLEGLLHRMCASLQIAASQHSIAEERYQLIATLLSEDDYFKDAQIDIYSQGSLRIGTTVKPLSNQEFDLDFVLEVTGLAETKTGHPVQFLNDITDILKKHGTYEDMVEKMNRCVRLTYANDFHMDILPGKPTNGEHPNCIEVPDRKAEAWKPSNPKGYADWFEDIAADYQPYGEMQKMFEASANVDPLPGLEPLEQKPPLKRAVQLLKRHRDIVFEHDQGNAPISIVLTTLAGELYQKQGSVYEALLGILQGIVTRIQKEGYIRIYNPKNREELLSERWENNKEMYEKFVSFITSFAEKWENLPRKIHSAGFEVLNESLGGFYGGELAKNSFIKEATFQRKLQESGLLKMSPSGLVVPVAANITNSVPIHKNTFYGD
jgi:hypothetical protein